MGKTLNDIAPYPQNSADVTADALARHFAVLAQAEGWLNRKMPPAGDKEALGRWYDAIGSMCSNYAVTRLLRELIRLDPAAADDVARQVWGDWEDGVVIPESLYDWLHEYGIDSEQVHTLVEADQEKAEQEKAA